MGTRVTEESWFGRIGGAFKGILVGGLLTVVAVPILFWNEGRAVRTAQGLKEGAKVVVDIKPDAIDSGNDGKFVHTSGDVQTTDVLRDDDFAIEFNGIRLDRHVEMYQWSEDEDRETKKKIGGGTRTTTTFTYDKGWYSGLIDSREFDEAETHQNPNQVLFADKSEQAKNVSLGQFRLPDSLIGMISGQDPVELSESNLPEAYRDRATIRKDGPNGAARIYISATKSQPAAQPTALLDQPDPGSPETGVEPAVNPNRPELIDLEAKQPAQEPASVTAQPLPAASPAGGASELGPPQIGDVRIWFTATPVQTVSLLSQQSGESFQPYATQSGTTINVLRVGNFSAAEMIAQEEATNRMFTWVLRGVGTFVMFLGLTLLLRPLVVLADVLPIAGSLVGFGTAIVAGLLTIAGSMTVIGVAWLFYRPLLGGTLLVVAAAAIFFLFKRGRKSRSTGPEMLTDADLA
ncbi:MAG: TMEM43 family protein [Planctomycetales bacterium]|nr:TMEM43 family protein [Planctomycetales bacterium]